MKKKIIYLCLFIFLANSYAQKKETFDILSNAQNTIDLAFLNAFKKDTVLPLQNQEELLNKIVVGNSKNIGYYKNYWTSYLKYKKAIFYFKLDNKKKSKEEASASIKLLEFIEDKDSEVYALLSLVQSFNFQFIPKQNFMVYLNKSIKNLDKSISLNPKNLRAYYVNASYDFYTPEEYGGGKKTEQMLLKAISIDEKTSKSSFAPFWGKELSFDLLIQYYLKKKSIQLAKKYYKQALNLYPTSHAIRRHKEIYK